MPVSCATKHDMLKYSSGNILISEETVQQLTHMGTGLRGSEGEDISRCVSERVCVCACMYTRNILPRVFRQAKTSSAFITNHSCPASRVTDDHPATGNPRSSGRSVMSGGSTGGEMFTSVISYTDVWVWRPEKETIRTEGRRTQYRKVGLSTLDRLAASGKHW